MKGLAMPRHATLFAAALLAFSINVSAQTAPPVPVAATQASPAGLKTNTCSKPVYPREAIRNEWTGTSTIAFLIGTDGSVKDTKVVKSRGHDILDEAARVGLSQCQFRPATRNGKLVETWQPVQYVWTLD
jgi:protein TonB